MSDDSFHHRRIPHSVTSQLLLCLSPQWMWKVPHTQWRVSFFQKRLWGLGVLSIHALRGSVRVVVARRGHTKLPALLSLTHKGWRLFETEYPTWVFDIWEQWQIQRLDLHHWFLWYISLVPKRDCKYLLASALGRGLDLRDRSWLFSYRTEQHWKHMSQINGLWEVYLWKLTLLEVQWILKNSLRFFTVFECEIHRYKWGSFRGNRLLLLLINKKSGYQMKLELVFLRRAGHFWLCWHVSSNIKDSSSLWLMSYFFIIWLGIIWLMKVSTLSVSPDAVSKIP